MSLNVANSLDILEYKTDDAFPKYQKSSNLINSLEIQETQVSFFWSKEEFSLMKKNNNLKPIKATQYTGIPVKMFKLNCEVFLWNTFVLNSWNTYFS